MKKGKIFIISGPSGSGKTTLYNKLLAHKTSLAKSISVTTRPRRKGERHGRDYIFVSKKMFLYKKRAGHFLESENVFGNYYGTPVKSVRSILKKGKHVLLCIDVKGARAVKRKFPEAISIFVKTPDLKTLENRLRKRGSEAQATILVRLKRAKMELRYYKNYSYVIINDSINRAYSRLEKIIEKELKV